MHVSLQQTYSKPTNLNALYSSLIIAVEKPTIAQGI